MSQSNTEKTKRRWLSPRGVIVFLIVCSLLYFFHPRIFTALGSVLVYQDPQPASADILAVSGDGSLQEVLTWLRQHDQSRLILVERPPPRVVQIGATQSDAQRSRQVAEAAGVALERVKMLPADSFRQVRPVRIMGKWLTQYPEQDLYVLCDEFHSRALRLVIDRNLPESQSSRIMLKPLPNRRFSVSDWWRSRLGSRMVFRAYIGLVRTFLGLRTPDPPPYLSPEEYEQQFLASLDIQT